MSENTPGVHTIPTGLTRRVYESKIISTIKDTIRRVTVAEYAGRHVVEIRDFALVPTGVGESVEEVPSSGAFLRLADVVALRKTLQRIEADYELSDGE